MAVFAAPAYHRGMRLAFSLTVALALVGCMGPATPAQRLSETAYDYSTAMRFGRYDVAFGHVSDEAREEISKQHVAWGRSLRIVDLEMGGLSMKAKDEAEVVLNVTWQRPDEIEVRSTQVKQTWKDDRGWRVVAEERASGDSGLLGEVTPEPTDAAPRPTRFATRVIRGD